MEYDTIKRLFGQFVHGIKYLYEEKRIVHRDYKPENILMAEDGDPVIKICDFGFSRTYCDKMATTAGTPTEASEEILDGEEYDETTDLYSIGCVLYFLVYAKRPYDLKEVDDDDPDVIIQYIRNHDIVIDDTEKKLKPATTLLKKLLAKNRNERITWDVFLKEPFVLECLTLVEDNLSIKFDELKHFLFSLKQKKMMIVEVL